MKNLILGFCLLGLAVACKSNDTVSVDDAGNPSLPAAECATDCATECSDAKAECSAEKAECSASKAECSAEKAECSGEAKPECSGAVCPVTGKPMN